MKAIIYWTLWQRRWSIFWWCIGIAAFVALEMSVYPSIKSQAAQLNQLLEHLPGTIRSFFGANGDLFSPTGYLNSRLFYLLLPLMLSILAIGLGSSLIAREESDGTIEFLLARPVSRGRLILAKLTGGFLMLAVVAGLSTIVILVGLKIVKLNVPLTRVAFAMAMASLMAILLGAVAFVISCIGKNSRGTSIGIASLVGLGGYIISSLEIDVHWLRWPAKFLPYHYYNPTSIFNGNYTWAVATAFGALSVIMSIIAWQAFRSRDLGL